MTEPRDVRNNNPLNIKHSSDTWEGMSTNQTDPDFVSYISPVFGFRAGFRIFIRYSDAYGINTIRKLITRWSATDQGSYIDTVSKKVGIGPDVEINIKSYATARALVMAMTEVESGLPFAQNWKEKDLAEGALRAGIVDAPKSPIKKIGVVAAGLGASAASIAPTAIEAFTNYRGYFDAFKNPAFQTTLSLIGAILALLAIFNHLRASQGSAK